MSYFPKKVCFRSLLPPVFFIYRLLTVNVCYPLAVWTLEDLIASVGSIDRGAAIKALSTWVDHGVLKEDPESTFILLEKAEGDSDVGMTRQTRGIRFVLISAVSVSSDIIFLSSTHSTQFPNSPLLPTSCVFLSWFPKPLCLSPCSSSSLKKTMTFIGLFDIPGPKNWQNMSTSQLPRSILHHDRLQNWIQKFLFKKSM